MDIKIVVHNMDLTTTLQDYVEKKTGRLDRYMPNIRDVQVDLSQQNARSATERQIAQITVRDSRGTILRAEESSNDMFAAVDAVIDKLYRQIKRYRGKVRSARRPNAEEMIMAEVPLPLEEEEEIEEDRTIVRRKRFALRPMAPEEAIEQMELLGHDFFVFFNAEEEAVNVLYKRHDENYGLLQPELD